MEKKSTYRCSLCFTKLWLDGTTIGDKEDHFYEIYAGIRLPFCCSVHKEKYKQLIECPNVYFKEGLLCRNTGCISRISPNSVNCLCGVAHKFCSTDCRDKLNKKIHKPMLPYAFSSSELNKLKEEEHGNKLNKSLMSIPNLGVLNTNCTTCFCGNIDKDSKCSAGHERCIMCEFRGRCRKCESKTWYQRPLYYFYMDLTWQQYEDNIDTSYIPQCSVCKRQQIEVVGKGDEYYYIERTSRLYLVQPCNHIVCINCSHRIDELSCGKNHIQISCIFFNEIGNTHLWSLSM